MKKFFAFALATLLLFGSSVPAQAVRYVPETITDGSGTWTRQVQVSDNFVRKDSHRQINADGVVEETTWMWSSTDGVKTVEIETITETRPDGFSRTKSQKTIGEFVGTFTDVPTTAWHANAISKASLSGIVNGTSDTTFEPNANVSWAEACQMLMNINTLQAKTRTAPNDVMGPWYALAVHEIEKKGITVTNPCAPISRAQLATMLYADNENSYMSSLANKYLPGDCLELSEKTKSAIKFCVKQGLMIGDDKGKFNPDDTLTRAEAATVLVRLAEKRNLIPKTVAAMRANAIAAYGRQHGWTAKVQAKGDWALVRFEYVQGGNTTSLNIAIGGSAKICEFWQTDEKWNRTLDFTGAYPEEEVKVTLREQGPFTK